MSNIQQEDKQGGAIAVSAGHTLENIVVGALTSKGLKVFMYRHWEKTKEQCGHELLLKNVPYTTIYGHHGNTEFLALSEQYQVNTRIECKWQQASGSVDEKFPYLFANCVECMTEPHVIILLDGGGAKRGAVKWLHRACCNYTEREQATSGRVIELMDVMEFICWANQKFKRGI